MLRGLIAIVFSFTLILSMAQTCSIISSSIVCKEELMNFDVTASSGISSVLWDMGDGTTSTQQSFNHKYSAKGIKNIQVTLNLTGGGTCVATKQITVYELPKFKISQKADNNYCLWQNNICLIDSSTGGDSGVTITKRIILWDDGNQDVTNNPPMGDKVCHHYNNSGTYKITIELTNDKGCKTEYEVEITILKDVVPKIYVFSIENKLLKFCDSARTEFYDITALDTNTVINRIYDWGDGSPKDSTKSKHVSHFYKKSGFYKVSLSYVQKNGCITTRDTLIEVVVYSVKFNLTKNAYQQCLGSVFRFTQTDVYSGAYYRWYLSVKDSLQNIFPEDQIDAKTYDFMIDLGRKKIWLEITNYGCTKKSDKDSVEAIGMVPETKALNNLQCENRDTVYFISKVRKYGVGKLYYLWDFGDDKAPNCTTEKAKGLNINSNCNYSTDSLSKHFYINGICRSWSLSIIDSFSGCPSQYLSGIVNVAKRDTVKFEYYYDRLCIGNKVDYYIGFRHNLCGPRIQTNLDSACDKDRWSTRFVGQTPYEKTCNPDGWVTVGFAITSGSPFVYTGFNDTVDFYIDSNRVCYDTIWKHNWFKLEKDPDARFDPDPKCINYLTKPILKDSIQKNIKFSSWNWYDKSANDTIVMAKGDTIIPSKGHVFKKAGIFVISHYLENENRCYSRVFEKVVLGFNMSFYYDTIICPGTMVQFIDEMNYTDSNLIDGYKTNSKNYWHIAKRKQQNKEIFRWDFGDGRGFVTDTVNPVTSFPQSGYYKVRLAAKDSLNCWDTLSTMVNVGGANAGIRHISKKIICDGIVQLYDSSYSDYMNDSITKYFWDFGDGGNPSYVQNPFHYYSTFGNYTIFQRVESSRGCTDTAYINIVIEGPVAGFNIIGDTVGCAPVKAVFKNTSIKTKDYIWYFGDPLKTKLSTNQDTNVSFTYTKPGTYFIYLFGIDSVKNPNAGNAIYYCKSFFPDTSVANHPVRKIVVLPAPKADFNVNFIQCKNKPITVTANSDSLYILNRWKITGVDSIETTDKTGTLFSKDTGTFAIKYKPWYPPKAPYNISCSDSVTKLVKVTEIKAAFDLLKDTAGCPVFTFTNQTKNYQTITWNLGDSAAGDEKNIQHQNQVTYRYVSRKGAFNPCLFAENSDGCRDTLCTTVNVDFVVKLKIPNVFTPGNDDHLNDAFDIQAEGIEDYHLVIYNRWGQKMFETDTDGIGDDGYNWRGRPNIVSDLYPDGTYFYILNYKIKCEDKAKEAHGTITLIGGKN